MKSSNSPYYILLITVLSLLGLGLLTIYSSSGIYALEKYGRSTYFLWRQLLWIVLGSFACLFFTLYDHRKLKTWVPYLLMITWVLLIGVLLFGHRVGGAKRWLRFMGIGFQPSELAKLALVIFSAYYCDKKRSKMSQFYRGLLPPLGIVGFTCGLIFLQPDLGTPVLIFTVCLMILFMGGAPWKQMFGIGVTLLPIIGLAIWFEPYRRRRLLSFLNPWENMQGTSYQLVQSLLAMGSGGLLGVGLGGSHSKLLYLPEPHTDFIFPILAEELGLLGSLIVLGLFTTLSWIGFRCAEKSEDLFSRLLAAGITLLIVIQAIINLAMVTGCMPTKGLPLPFISFGGTSLLVTMSCVGILLNISKKIKV